MRTMIKLQIYVELVELKNMFPLFFILYYKET